MNFVFFTWPCLRGEEQVPAGLVVAGVDDRLDLLVRCERQQVDDGGAARRALLHRDLVRLQAVDPPAVGEEQQVGVRRGVEDVGDVVLVLQLGAADAAPAAALGAEGVGRDRLHVALATW